MFIYIEAVMVWLVYTLITKFLLFKTVIFDSSFRSYVLSAFVSGVFGCLFLYIFSHEDFFKFAKIIEKRESKAEQGWRHKFIHFGKVFSVFLVTVFAGPMIGALSTRLLLNKNSWNYLIILLASILTAVIWLSIYHGAVIFSGFNYLYGRK